MLCHNLLSQNSSLDLNLGSFPIFRNWWNVSPRKPNQLLIPWKNLPWKSFTKLLSNVMDTMIDNFINGNLTDAKRQAKRFSLHKIYTALLERYNVRKASAIAVYLKNPSQISFQATCDAWFNFLSFNPGIISWGFLLFHRTKSNY